MLSHRIGNYGGWTVLVHCWGCDAGLNEISAASGIPRHILLRWPPPHELGPPVSRGRAPAVGRVGRGVSQPMIDGWASALWANPAALAYLREKRGLNNETILRYELGCEDGEWIVLPCWDERGRICGVKRRALDPDADPKTLNSLGNSTIYPDMPDSRGVVLVGGEMDALTGRQLGLPTVTPTCGPFVSPPHILRRFRGKRVFVMFDVGENYKIQSATILLRPVAAEVRVVDLARLKRGAAKQFDLNDAHRLGISREQILALIQRAGRQRR